MSHMNLVIKNHAQKLYNEKIQLNFIIVKHIQNKRETCKMQNLLFHLTIVLNI